MTAKIYHKETTSVNDGSVLMFQITSMPCDPWPIISISVPNPIGVIPLSTFSGWFQSITHFSKTSGTSSTLEILQATDMTAWAYRDLAKGCVSSRLINY
jgi:hypothetical protein